MPSDFPFGSTFYLCLPVVLSPFLLSCVAAEDRSALDTGQASPMLTDKAALKKPASEVLECSLRWNTLMPKAHTLTNPNAA